MHTLQPEGAWASPPPDSLNPYSYDPLRATLPLYQDVLIVAYRRSVTGIDLDGSAPIDVSFPEKLAAARLTK
jgi:hypothetical protein